jgi:hypothetical protein
MTPIKLLLLVGTSIYTVDYAGRTSLVSVSPSTGVAQWVLNGLAEYHHVPARIHEDDLLPGPMLDVKALETLAV